MSLTRKLAMTQMNARISRAAQARRDARNVMTQTYSDFAGSHFGIKQREFFGNDNIDLFREVFKLVGERIGLVYGDELGIGREFMLQGMLITQIVDDLFMGCFRREDDLDHLENSIRHFPSTSGGLLVFRYLGCMKWA